MGRPSHNPVRAARRKAELQDKLGSERPICFYCGYAEPVALRRVSRQFLEEHHPLGRKLDSDLTVYLCRNCHALSHENLLDSNVDLRLEADPRLRLAMILRAEAVHFDMLAKAKRQQARMLEGETK